MRIHLIAVGRQKAGPESELVTDYLTRFDRTGRALGLGPAQLREVEDRKATTMASQAQLLQKAIPSGALICTLDERGKLETSPQFANRLSGWRDAGQADVAFVIGGADGIDPGLRAQADHAVSFGKMVWPHMLARVMLAEQLYRAATILSGSPYHRV